MHAKIVAELYELFATHLRSLRGLEPMKQSYQTATHLVKTFLERHRGDVRPKNLELAALLVVATVDRCTEAVVLNSEDANISREAAEQITDLVVGYLRVP